MGPRVPRAVEGNEKGSRKATNSPKETPIWWQTIKAPRRSSGDISLTICRYLQLNLLIRGTVEKVIPIPHPTKNLAIGIIIIVV